MKIRTALLGAALVGSMAWLGACVGQPQINCQIQASNPYYGLAAYWQTYTKVSATGACGDTVGEAIGFSAFNPPGTNDFTVAFRSQAIGDEIAGNNASGIPRVDSSDPEGKKANGSGKLTSYPGADNYCDVTDFVAPDQTFDATPDTPLDDGGIDPGLPVLHKKYEWSKLRFISTVNTPGSIFTGAVKYTEDTCTADFTVLGLWPQVGCDPANNEMAKNGYNIDCDPVAKVDEDAGYNHPLGSGINPTFATDAKPLTCGVGGFCELQLSVDDIAKL